MVLLVIAAALYSTGQTGCYLKHVVMVLTGKNQAEKGVKTLRVIEGAGEVGLHRKW